MQQSRKLLSLLCAFAAVTFFASASVAQQTTNEDQKKLEQLLQSLEQAKARIDKNIARQGKLENSIRQIETDIGELAKQQRSLRTQQQKTAADIKKLEQQQIQLQKQIDEQKALVSEHLVKMYKAGNRNPVQLLLENGNPADIDRQLEYLSRINQARNQLLNNYSELLTRQKNNFLAQQAKQELLEQTTRELAIRRQKLEQLQAERKSSLAKINQAINSDTKQVEQLEQDRDALQMLLEEMTAALSRAPLVDTDFSGVEDDQPFASAAGQLSWPVKGQLRKPADSRWGGISIVSDEGSPVKAVFPGRVIFADWFRGQGLLLIVDHGEGYWSLYGHNQSLLKNEGDTVFTGETIATVGNSGGQAESALYFEIRHKGTPSDPKKWCKS